MMNMPRIGRVLTLAACFGALPLHGCSDDASPATNADESARASGMPAGDPSQVYENVRAVVVALPEGTKPMQLHHEAIPNFIAPATGEVHKNADGSTGMKEMVMPMPIAQGLSLEGIEPGDKVAFTLAVWSSPTIVFYVTAIDELPADTELNLTLP